MLILALVVVAILYCGLYLFWSSAQTHISTLTDALHALNEAVVMPQGTVFLILRGLILVTLFYVGADWLMSAARGLKRRAQERNDPTLKANALKTYMPKKGAEL